MLNVNYKFQTNFTDTEEALFTKTKICSASKVSIILDVMSHSILG